MDVAARPVFMVLASGLAGVCLAEAVNRAARGICRLRKKKGANVDDSVQSFLLDGLTKTTRIASLTQTLNRDVLPILEEADDNNASLTEAFLATLPPDRVLRFFLEALESEEPAPVEQSASFTFKMNNTASTSRASSRNLRTALLEESLGLSNRSADHPPSSSRSAHELESDSVLIAGLPASFFPNNGSQAAEDTFTARKEKYQVSMLPPRLAANTWEQDQVQQGHQSPCGSLPDYSDSPIDSPNPNLSSPVVGDRLAAWEHVPLATNEKAQESSQNGSIVASTSKDDATELTASTDPKKVNVTAPALPLTDQLQIRTLMGSSDEQRVAASLKNGDFFQAEGNGSGHKVSPSQLLAMRNKATQVLSDARSVSDAAEAMQNEQPDGGLGQLQSSLPQEKAVEFFSGPNTGTSSTSAVSQLSDWHANTEAHLHTDSRFLPVENFTSADL